MIDLISEGIAASVNTTVRETVETVAALDVPAGVNGVMVTRIAQQRGIDKAAASRRVRVALDSGYLVNLEERKGRPARLVIGDALPEDRAILPAPDVFAAKGGGVLLSPQSTGQQVNSPRNAPAGSQIGVLGGEIEAEDLAEWQKSLLAEYESGFVDPAY